MSKFGLMDEGQESTGKSSSTAVFAEKLAAFPLTTPKHRIDVAAMDAAAAAHGFISREVPNSPTPTYKPAGRRRRTMQVEPTRHLAIRLTASQYDRFVAYADRHKLTYHDALTQLIDTNEQSEVRADRERT